MTKIPHHLCSVVMELKAFLEKSLTQKNKLLRKDIKGLVESMNLAQEHNEIECIEEKEDNSQYFT